MSTAIVTTARRHSAAHNFWRHFLEMVVAMFVGMAVLGGAVSGIFALLGHSDVLHYAALRAFLMEGYMIVGMSLWMRHRGHEMRSIAEMVFAMLVPYLLLIGPFEAGLISRGVLLIGEHALMFPAMLLAMLYRRDEYSMDHRHHRGTPRPVSLRTPLA